MADLPVLLMMFVGLFVGIIVGYNLAMVVVDFKKRKGRGAND